MLKSSFLIVGGGIVGHLIAWKICHAYPAATVTLLERDVIGSGATGRSAGLHFPLGRSAAVRAMSEASEAFYERFRAAEAGAPIVPLALRVHAADNTTADWQSIFTRGARLSPDPEGARVAERLGSRHRVWRAHGAQRADARALTAYIGVRLNGRLSSYTGIKVDGIVEKESVVQLFTMDGLVFSAGTVILAPGPWALAAEFKPFTQDLGIRVKRVVAFHLDPSAEDDSAAEAVDLFVDDDAFLMPRGDGRGRLFSFTRQRWDVSPEESSAGIGTADREEAVRILRDVAPRLSDAIIGGQAFCDAYSPTRVPIVAEVGRSDRIIFAGAANGSGYRLAPAIADGVLNHVAARQAREMV